MKICSKTFAIITGGANGIGKEITIALLKEGAKVSFIDVDHKEGKKTENELQQNYGMSKVTFINCDITKKKEFEDVLRKEATKNEGIDILCNNAAIFHKQHNDNWEALIETNLVAVIRSTFVGLELMDKTKGGRGGTIINVASLSGMRPHQYAPVYSASKHGVVGFTRSVAQTSLEKGVYLNMICPGFVDTQMTRDIPNKTWADMIERVGRAPPKLVAEGFIQLVKSDNRNGEAMTVTLADGIGFHKFE